jgi:dihydropteroate synthase
LLQLAARESAALVLMHMQGEPESMQMAPTYQDVVAEVLAGLLAAARTAEAAGVARDSILIDPGIGFGKTREHNLRLLAGLPQFVATGYPVLLGTSRKRFMGAICRETSPTDLMGATCATTALGVTAGVKVFRVHDVRPNRQAAEVAWAIGAIAG